MPPLTILSDQTVSQILQNLTPTSLTKFRTAITKTLISFSTGSERTHQPDPSSTRRPNNQRVLFRPFTSPSHVGVKIVVSPSKPAEPLHGVLVLCDDLGLPVGLVNAEEVTGFRTTMSAMLLWMFRAKTERVVVFGAGKQALWHVRLMLMLRGNDVKSIVLVNRNYARAETTVSQLRSENAEKWRVDVRVEALDTRGEYRGQLEALIRDADAVFCTTPSTEILFPASWLAESAGPTGEGEGEGKGKGCYVSAIGSWQADMIELDPDLIHEGIERAQRFNPRGEGRDEWGVIVDHRDDVLHATGEFTRGRRFEERNVVEVGEVLEAVEVEGEGGKGGDGTGKGKEGLKRWLRDGFVVYKSVGVGVTDLTMGVVLLDVARERGMGVGVDEF